MEGVELTEIRSADQITQRKALRVTPFAGGNGLRVQTDLPHLVSLGGGRLSTAVTLLPLPPGKTTIGSGQAVDLVISGSGVEPQHCYIINDREVVTLHPLSPLTAVDGRKINNPTRIQQGAMLCFGRSTYFRFNHPNEASRMRAKFPAITENLPPVNYNQYRNGIEDNHPDSTTEDEGSSQNLYDNLYNLQPPRLSRRDSYLQNHGNLENPSQGYSYNPYDSDSKHSPIGITSPSVSALTSYPIPYSMERLSTNSQSLMSLPGKMCDVYNYNSYNRFNPDGGSTLERRIAELENSRIVGGSGQEIPSVMARGTQRHSINTEYSTAGNYLDNPDFWGVYDNVTDIKNNLHANSNNFNNTLTNSGNFNTLTNRNEGLGSEYRDSYPVVPTHGTTAHGLSIKRGSRTSDSSIENHCLTDTGPTDRNSCVRFGSPASPERATIAQEMMTSRGTQELSTSSGKQEIVRLSSTQEQMTSRSLQSSSAADVAAVTQMNHTETDSNNRDSVVGKDQEFRERGIETDVKLEFNNINKAELQRLDSTTSECSSTTSKQAESKKNVKEKPPAGKQKKEKKVVEKKKKEKVVSVKTEVKENKGESSPKGSFFRSLLNRSRSPSPGRASKRSESPLMSKGSEVAKRLSEPLKASFKLGGFESKPKVTPRQGAIEEGNEEEDSRNLGSEKSSVRDSMESKEKNSSEDLLKTVELTKNDSGTKQNHVILENNHTENEKIERFEDSNHVRDSSIDSLDESLSSLINSNSAIYSKMAAGSAMTLPSPKTGQSSIFAQSNTTSVAAQNNPWCVNLKELKLKPNLEHYKGEKVFTKDTVTTSVVVPGIDTSLSGRRASKSGSVNINNNAANNNSSMNNSAAKSVNESLNSSSASSKNTSGNVLNNKTVVSKSSASNEDDISDSPLYDSVYEEPVSPRKPENNCDVFDVNETKSSAENNLNATLQQCNNTADSIVKPDSGWSDIDSDLDRVQSFLECGRLLDDNDEFRSRTGSSLSNSVRRKTNLHRDLDKQQMNVLEALRNKHLLTVSAESRLNRLLAENQNTWDEEIDDASTLNRSLRKSGKSVKFKDEVSEDENERESGSEFPFPVNEEEMREALRRCNINDKSYIDQLVLTKSSTLPAYGRPCPSSAVFDRKDTSMDDGKLPAYGVSCQSSDGLDGRQALDGNCRPGAPAGPVEVEEGPARPLSDITGELQALYESIKAQRIIEEESANKEKQRLEEIRKLCGEEEVDAKCGDQILETSDSSVSQSDKKNEKQREEIQRTAVTTGNTTAIYSIPKARALNGVGGSEEKAVRLLTRRQSIMRRIASLKDQISEVSQQQKDLIQQHQQTYIQSLARQNTSRSLLTTNEGSLTDNSTPKELLFANKIHKLVQERNILEIECREANAEMVSVDEILQSLNPQNSESIKQDTKAENKVSIKKWFKDLDSQGITSDKINGGEVPVPMKPDTSKLSADIKFDQSAHNSSAEFRGTRKNSVTSSDPLAKINVASVPHLSNHLHNTLHDKSNKENHHHDKTPDSERLDQELSREVPVVDQGRLACAEAPGSNKSARDQDRASLRRPLTRYMPLLDSTIDLRSFTESCGHKIDQCQHVEVTASQCKGHLFKLSQGTSALRKWLKRWFVFDRSKRCLYYYADNKSELKPHKSIYFQSIQDVFVDHLHSVKSPNPSLTFCVKTLDRTYYLMAQSSEVMRIWIDVIFTGAEAHQQFL